LAAMGAACVMSCDITLAADVPAAPAENAATAGSPPAPQATQDTGGLAEVVVTGQRAAIRRAQDIKLNAIAVVDAVSAEEAGKFPDQNAPMLCSACRAWRSIAPAVNPARSRFAVSVRIS